MPPPSDPTPGYYPDSQGVMRLWDGQRWTEVTRPMPQPATAPAGQPGYYPDSQGVMRWWTGRDWAPNTQPPATAQPGSPNEPPKNWFQRNIGWKLAVLLGIAVLGSCSVIIGGTNDPDTTTTSTLPATQETSDAPEPEAEPEPEPTQETVKVGEVADIVQLLESPRRRRYQAERAPASDDRRRHIARSSRVTN